MSDKVNLYFEYKERIAESHKSGKPNQWTYRRDLTLKLMELMADFDQEEWLYYKLMTKFKE